MCGICGIIKTDGTVIDPELLIEMRDTLSHRGPDDYGCVFLKRRQDSKGEKQQKSFLEFKDVEELTSHDMYFTTYTVGLAHRRLSIIDLSLAGRQPMCNENGTVWITYNGEIYNYREIGDRLKVLGHRIKSNSDTEVIIHAYEEWGEDCLKYFNGMFAFAIYDSNKRHVFLARDRVGKKPLYYFRDNCSFLFASELKAIVKGLNRQLDIDCESLNFYLAFGYIPGLMCILKGVDKLPPAHGAVYDIEKNTIKTWQYWELPYPEDDNEKYSETELVDELEYLLENSVRLRLISDVPLGIFLSGGVDSSLVTAMAAKCSSSSVKTFTISFPGSGKYDESGYAKIIADNFKTDHHILSGKENIFDTLEEITPFIDEPIADSSLLPTYLVSKLTREYVTVALGGDGGDELFGGYSHYRQALRDKDKLKYIPKSFLQIIAKIAGKLPAGIKGRNRLYSLKGGYLEENIWSNPYFDSNLRKKLYSEKVLKELNSSLDAPEKWKLDLLSKGYDDIDKLTRLDFLSYLPEDIMTKVDRASMACSLEVRAPWLDYRIVEFAFKKVPPKYKVNNGETRILQKRLTERLLPKELNLNRKQGFSVPMDKLLRGDKKKSFQKYLSKHNDLFSQKEIEALVFGEMKGRKNASRLFALMIFECGGT